VTSPAHRDLQRVAASLAARLPDQLDGLLEDPRFEAGRQALERLRDPAVARDLAGVDPREAAWLEEELRRRWAAIGDVVLDPVAWVEGPPALDQTAPVRLTVRTDGLEPGWTVAWSGADPDPEDPTAALLPADVGPSPTDAPASVTARVMGRGPDGRVILLARWSAPEVDATSAGRPAGHDSPPTQESPPTRT
jgi:hypothetical protein